MVESKPYLVHLVRKENYAKPLWLEKVGNMVHQGLFEIVNNSGPTQWYVSFNGNSKQRRQRRRKFLKELNQ